MVRQFDVGNALCGVPWNASKLRNATEGIPYRDSARYLPKIAASGIEKPGSRSPPVRLSGAVRTTLSTRLRLADRPSDVVHPIHLDHERVGVNRFDKLPQTLQHVRWVNGPREEF